MHEVRSCVVATDGITPIDINFEGDRRARVRKLRAIGYTMQVQSGRSRNRVGYVNVSIGPRDGARIAHLAARFGIERGAIHHNALVRCDEHGAVDGEGVAANKLGGAVFGNNCGVING